MSYSPDYAIAAALSLSRARTSGAARAVFKLPTTSSTPPPPGPLADGCDGVFYFRGVLSRQVAPRDKPPPDARRQLKADNICAVELERLHREVLFRSVEHGDTATVRTRCL